MKRNKLATRLLVYGSIASLIASMCFSPKAFSLDALEEFTRRATQVQRGGTNNQPSGGGSNNPSREGGSSSRRARVGSTVSRPVRPPNRRPPARIPERLTVTPIEMGAVLPGVLGRSDASSDGRRYEVFTFSGSAGKPIVLTVAGSNDRRPSGRLPLDPYAIILGPNEQVIDRNDIVDGPRTSTDERFWLRLPEDGTYKVVVFADPGEIGRFSLSLQEDRTRYLTDIVGELTNSDLKLNSDNSPFDIYQIAGNADQYVNIQLNSLDFDTYLLLVDSEGNLIAEDDDSGGNLNSRIEVQLEETGIYYVIVNVFAPEGRGDYRLTIY